MNDIEITKLDLVEGGNVFKQGHYLTLGYAPRDRSGELVNLEGKDIAVSLYNRYGVSYETTARFDAGNLYFDVKTTIPSGEMFVEFTATDPNDESYRMKFPTNPNAAKLSVVPSTDDLGNNGITIYTVSKLLNEQKKVQQEYESTVDGKLSTVEQRLEDGIGAFTEDTEVLDARMGEVNLRAFNEKTTAQLAVTANYLNGIGVNVNMMGAVGDGVNDDGPALRTSVEYLESKGGGTLYLPAGSVYACSLFEYPSGRSSVIQLSNNVRVDMTGAKIKLLPNENSVSYNMIAVFDGDSCHVEGGTLIGNKQTSTATTGEWGMGIGLYGASNFTSNGTVVEACWGDGIYIGVSPTKKYCENVKLTNVICDDNRRQGLSLISCKNLIVENFIAINTSGTAPADGIDIEPNSPDEFLENIRFVNIQTANNEGSGIKFYMANLDETSAPVSITVEKHVDNSTISDSSFRVRRIRKKTKGFIHALNCSWKNKGTRIFCHEECASTGIKTITEDCDFYYFGDEITEPFIYSTGARYSVPPSLPEDIEASTVGNIHMIRPSVYSADGVLKSPAFYVRGYDGFSHDNVSFIDPVVLEVLTISQSGLTGLFLSGITERVKLKDENKLLVNSQSLSMVAASSGRTQSEIENTSTATGRGVNISSYANAIGLEFTVKLSAMDGVIDPGATSTIRGFSLGASIKSDSSRLYSVTKLRVRAQNVFEIIETTTQWVPVV